MKNKNFYLVGGQLSLAISVLLNHFVKGNNYTDFFVGMFTGLSITMNIAFLIFYKRDEKKLS